MGDTNNETEEQKELRLAKRREFQELIGHLLRMRPLLHDIPGSVERWRETMHWAENSLKDLTRDSDPSDDDILSIFPDG